MSSQKKKDLQHRKQKQLDEDNYGACEAKSAPRGKKKKHCLIDTDT